MKMKFWEKEHKRDLDFSSSQFWRNVCISKKVLRKFALIKFQPEFLTAKKESS